MSAFSNGEVATIKKGYIALLLLLVFFGVSETSYAEPKEEIEQKITQLQERLSKLNNEISTTVVEQEEQENKIATLDRELAVQEKKVADMTNKLTQLEAEIK